ncbi:MULTISPECIES: cache domain-containing protein [unclassified Aureimonas]|uniref:cache domain-containing protein n=1 Tax=unclassified Aureimonas TaxID=2615206 RepID=UPI0006FA4242|nr:MULTISPECIES: cache domain-containing protein [unclassified Aureimonas]KQT55192.1 hypothetical protein ASG62_10150 [Aureimonas sp. Leaf427]KQT70982.1 hypothetical protein ASG54_20535 [Aureimonas sp. Leaf460]
MRFRSIQMKIAVLSGVCVLGATGALVLGSSIASNGTVTFVADTVGELVKAKTAQSIASIAATNAGSIRSTLDHAFDSARIMARSFEILAKGDADAPGLDDRRDRFNAILLGVLKDNPGFNGTYSAWEPDALDGSDGAYKNRRDVGSDATGRFLPYWTRDAGGRVAVQPLVEYDSHDLHPNGVMKGGWYIGPQTGQGESILAPLPYVVQGKNVHLATMSVPITIDGTFKGVVGADFDLAFVQALALDVKRTIYGGSSAISIVSGEGLVVASSEHPEAIG